LAEIDNVANEFAQKEISEYLESQKAEESEEEDSDKE